MLHTLSLAWPCLLEQACWICLGGQRRHDIRLQLLLMHFTVGQLTLWNKLADVWKAACATCIYGYLADILLLTRHA